MDWLEDFRPQLERLFQQAEKRVRAFPAPLHEIGLRYLSAFDIRTRGSTKNYICYLLPFWLERMLSARLESSASDALLQTARQAALGNVMGMLHFFIQDDLMDMAQQQAAEDAPDMRSLIPLSQLLHSEFIQAMSAATSSQHHDQLWEYYQDLCAEWASAVYDESESDYFLQARHRVAGKASPIKLSVIIMMLEANLASQLPALLEQLERVLLVLQMNDDAADWREDLASGSYNCLLSLIRHEYDALEQHADEAPSTPTVLTEVQVQQAIYDRHILQRYTSMAADSYIAADTASLNPYLSQFHAYLIRQLTRMSEQVEQHRSLLLQQGSIWYYAKLSN
ncbi:hypothetical protein SK066_18645 [Paenibacillus hunanensis]|uniref:hypothetical protein n=1 Tax=Paenibacillus hunanensis TaxID=539262 RepID=UPI002A69EFDC|nr:hypothetical protein [Paenibacillus hunanensis]WPP40593.1 hypothetical protein SK066_18645 [Paenibacillus hunanensis]